MGSVVWLRGSSMQTPPTQGSDAAMLSKPFLVVLTVVVWSRENVSGLGSTTNRRSRQIAFRSSELQFILIGQFFLRAARLGSGGWLRGSVVQCIWTERGGILRSTVLRAGSFSSCRSPTECKGGRSGVSNPQRPRSRSRAPIPRVWSCRGVPCSGLSWAWGPCPGRCVPRAGGHGGRRVCAYLPKGGSEQACYNQVFDLEPQPPCGFPWPWSLGSLALGPSRVAGRCKQAGHQLAASVWLVLGGKAAACSPSPRLWLSLRITACVAIPDGKGPWDLPGAPRGS